MTQLISKQTLLTSVCLAELGTTKPQLVSLFSYVWIGRKLIDWLIAICYLVCLGVTCKAQNLNKNSWFQSFAKLRFHITLTSEKLLQLAWFWRHRGQLLHASLISIVEKKSSLATYLWVIFRNFIFLVPPSEGG